MVCGRICSIVNGTPMVPRSSHSLLTGQDGARHVELRARRRCATCRAGQSSMRRRAERANCSASRPRACTLIARCALRADQCGAQREQLERDVDRAEQERLLALELRSEAQHAVEDAAREPPTGARREAHVRASGPYSLKPKKPSSEPSHCAGYQPRVKQRDARQLRELLGQRQLRIDQRARDLQVLVDRFARDEQMHDLARALEDPVDAAVAQHALDADRHLAARLPASARSRSRDRRGSAARGRVSSQPRSVFHSLAAAASRRMSRSLRSASAPTTSAIDSIAKAVAAMSASPVRDRFVLADRQAPLLARDRPLAADLRAPAWPRRRSPLAASSGPVFSVASAIRRPSPSSPTRFSIGTLHASRTRSRRWRARADP